MSQERRFTDRGTLLREGKSGDECIFKSLDGVEFTDLIFEVRDYGDTEQVRYKTWKGNDLISEYSTHTRPR